MRLTSILFHPGLLLAPFAQEDVEQESCDHDNHGSYLNTVVAVPSKDRAAYKQNGAQNNQDSSQIFLKAVHCYIVLFVFLLTAK